MVLWCVSSLTFVSSFIINIIFVNSSSLLWSVRRARVVFIGSPTKKISVHVAILTTAHAQLTHGRQEALISGPD